MSSSPPSAQRTLAVSVHNVNFILERLAEDCSPLQFLRELTKNSLEAIERLPDQSGKVIWDVEWDHFDLEGVYKLAIYDTGIGMSGPEMVKYINQLSRSIATQSIAGNYGIGAKISAGPRNPEGLMYLSWKDGDGAMIHFWKDPDSGEYGLRQFELPDGDFAYWAPIDEALKPDIIEDHGTVVVLLGSAPQDNTMAAPEGVASPSRWIARYLNSRFFRFPECIEVRAREGWDNPRTDKDRNLLRQLIGQEEYLRRHTESSGSVELDGATVHWWILRDEKALSQNSGFINSNGHVAAVYQNELYETQTSRAGVARLQQFGIYFGYQRVVLYLEPTNGEKQRIATNTARTHLLLNGDSLPWAEWAAQFRDQMPEAIRALVEDLASNVSSRDRQKIIRDRLKQIRELFRLSRYRPSRRGEFLIDDDAPRQGGAASSGGRSSTESRSGRGGQRGGRAGDLYALFVAEESGTRAEEVDANPYPEVQWISVAAGTRAPGFLEDRAAVYIEDTNIIQANSDFRGFSDLVDRWAKLYKTVPGARGVAEEVVKEWFEQSLVEVILGVQSLQGAKEWDPNQIARATSEEALTAAVMPRYHIDVAVRRAMGAKLGSLKDRKAS